MNMFANTLAIVIASLLAVTFAINCSPECECIPGTQENEYYCNGTGNGSDLMNFFIIEASDYVKVECMNDRDFSCSEVPKIPIFYNRVLNLLMLRNCRIPSGSLKEILNALDAAGAKKVNLQYTIGGAAAGMHADLFEGLHETTALAVSDLSDKPKLSTKLYDMSTYLTTLESLHFQYTNFSLSQPKPGVFPRLVSMTLAGSNLSEIPARSFKGLPLKRLYLQNNKMERLDGDAFEGLENLTILNLSVNRIKNISGNQWRNLPNIEVLELFSNNIEEVGSESFVALKKLKELKLFYNNRTMTFSPGALANISSLTSLELHWSQIRSLPEDLLYGSSAIVNLTLQKNFLTSLPAHIFRDQVNLQLLNLSGNKISSINVHHFRNLNKLVTLNLDHNNITHIYNDIFSSLINLKTLTINYNHIITLEPFAFKGLYDLQHLSLSNNELTLKPDTSTYFAFLEVTPFNSLTHLQHLNLSRNNISYVVDDWCGIMVFLQTLDLSYNKFTRLEIENLNFNSGNVIVNFDHNNISKVNLNSLYKNEYNNNDYSEINIGDNPLNCDCTLCDLRLKRNEIQPKFKLEETKCSTPQHLTGEVFVNIEPSDLICNLDEKCPKHCSCIKRCNSNTLEVTCTSEIHLAEYVPPIDYDIDSIDLTLKVQPSLSFLENLSRNFNFLRTLNLSSLDYKELPFIDSSNLTTIDLSDNSLSYIPINILSKNLFLAKNPIICDCTHRENIKALQDFKSHIIDYKLVKCTKGLLSTINAEQLCSLRDAAILASLIAFLGLLITSILVIMYRYMYVIKVFLFSHGLCRRFLHEEELDKNKIYDVFISYSHSDHSFVSDILLPKLEAPPNSFKICVHYRDWIGGEWIPSQIVRSVEESRRTIIVLSKNYIKSMWAKMEFQAACESALKENRVRLIIIILDDIKIDTLDDNLKGYLKFHTYLKWEDPWFWSKLIYALPHRRDERKLKNSSKKLAQKLDLHLNIDESFNIDNEVDKNIRGLNVTLTRDGKMINLANETKAKDNKVDGLNLTLTRDGKMINVTNKTKPEAKTELPKLQLNVEKLYDKNESPNLVDLSRFGYVNNIIDDYIANKNITKDDHFIPNGVMKRNENITKDDCFINGKLSKDIFTLNGVK